MGKILDGGAFHRGGSGVEICSGTLVLTMYYESIITIVGLIECSGILADGRLVVGKVLAGVAAFLVSGVSRLKRCQVWLCEVDSVPG